MKPKFIVKKAGELDPEKTVICRSDGDDIHGKNYMCVNADKPYAYKVYEILKENGIAIPFMEEALKELFVIGVEANGRVMYVKHSDGRHGWGKEGALVFNRGQAEEKAKYYSKVSGMKFEVLPYYKDH